VNGTEDGDFDAHWDIEVWRKKCITLVNLLSGKTKQFFQRETLIPTVNNLAILPAGIRSQYVFVPNQDEVGIRNDNDMTDNIHNICPNTTLAYQSAVNGDFHPMHCKVI
jgi:hypothetical protein